MATLTDFQKEKILNDITKIMTLEGNRRHKKWKQENAQLILFKLEQLDLLFYSSAMNKQNFISKGIPVYGYDTKEGWENEVYYIKKGKDMYNKAFILIEEILDLLRGGHSIVMEIYKTEKDEKGQIVKIEKYTSEETKLPLSQETSHSVNYLLSQIQDRQEMDEAFLKHYNNFRNLAIKHYQKQRTNKKGKVYYNFNEGHITEAFRRHLIWNNHKQDFSDRISKKHVAIMLWYSMNSQGWWAGGDVGYTQVKGNNTKIASHRSIREVASVLLKIIRNPENDLDENQIKKIFPQGSLQGLTDEYDLAKRKCDEIISASGAFLK